MAVRHWLPTIAALCVCGPVQVYAAPREADLILHHGKVVTVEYRVVWACAYVVMIEHFW